MHCCCILVHNDQTFKGKAPLVEGQCSPDMVRRRDPHIRKRERGSAYVVACRLVLQGIRGNDTGNARDRMTLGIDLQGVKPTKGRALALQTGVEELLVCVT